MSPAGLSDTLRVVCAVEGEAYVRHCAAMLHSVLAQHPGTPVHVDYLHGADTSESGRKRLAGMVRNAGGEITFHLISDGWVEGLPVTDFTRKATWYRISLDALLPNADRVLYLDVDLLVRRSLLPLWGTPLKGNVVGAVTNVPPPIYRAYTERPEMGGDRYFNAGVLLLDLAAMRREGLGDELREHARRHASRLIWRDQDVLNEVLHGRRLPLRPIWNCMNATYFGSATEYFDEEALAEARENPVIRHFEGPDECKPWHILSDRQSRREYVEHRRATPWPRVQPAGRTPMNMIRHARRTLRQLPRSAARRLLRRLV